MVSNSSPVAYLATWSLERHYPPAKEVPRDVEAIVILSGLVRNSNPNRGEPELGPSTIYRCLHGVVLHRALPEQPIVLSGGEIDGEGSPTASSVMREFLINQGVNPTRIILEERSRTTFENAVESGILLRDRNISRFALITSATHMHRTVLCFRKQGLDVIPSACSHSANGYQFEWNDLLPSVHCALQLDTAWHEWLGLAVYWARGRV
jgi:uncharacterized SAM-binding protein YcdF (DUF218 family)